MVRLFQHQNLATSIVYLGVKYICAIHVVYAVVHGLQISYT